MRTAELQTRLSALDIDTLTAFILVLRDMTGQTDPPPKITYKVQQTLREAARAAAEKGEVDIAATFQRLAESAY